MYKIGEFSKIVDLPVRTLRYYDEIGVLKPGFVDNFSNYRYYTDENLQEISLIKLLRNVGFSLEEIVLYKNNLSDEVLDSKIDELSMEINDLKSKILRLQIIKDEINKNEYISDNVIKLTKSIDEVKKVS